MYQDRINQLFNINEPKVSDQETFGVKTLRLRLKDKHNSYLTKLSNQVNTVWNFCNEHSVKVLRREHRFCSAFDLHPYLAGTGKELDIHSQTVQAIAEEYVVRRKQFKKAKLRWRVSRGSRRSLGWIPFKQSAISYKNGQVHLAGKSLSLWDSYGLKDFELGSGSISQDARGRWYINITVKALMWHCEPIKAQEKQDSVDPRGVIGIDLGLKDFLAASDGEKIQAQQIYRNTQEKLAIAQRANRPKRVRAIHAQIANRRKDFHHKLSTKLVSKNSAIIIGNVNASGLAQTTMAKSVLDAGWSSFRAMLSYKSDYAGVWFKEVNESCSTQDCNVCSTRAGPKGRAELDVRNWICPVCLTHHDRDTNAALNIKKRGICMMNSEFAIAAEKEFREPAMNKDTKEKLTKLTLSPESGYGLPAEGITAP